MSEEDPSKAAETPRDRLSWEEIYGDMPESIRDWPQNPKRKDYLSPGVFVDLTRMRVESWIGELRAVHEARGMVRLYLGMDSFPKDEPLIRVTIVEIPEKTRLDPVCGDIVVEAEGVRATISASIFYNCIKGPHKGITNVIGPVGRGWATRPPDWLGNVG
jgi:hypothetical protein